MCVCACVFSHSVTSNSFATPWTVACQATVGPGGLLFMGSQRVGHNRVTKHIHI